MHYVIGIHIIRKWVIVYRNDCIVLKISSIVFSSVDVFNLKFKKQSEKLKHYEGEHFKIADMAMRERDDRSISQRLRAFGGNQQLKVKNLYYTTIINEVCKLMNIYLQ